MVGDKFYFWMWVICGILGLVLFCIGLLKPGLIIWNISRVRFENITSSFSVFFIVSSWVFSLNLAIKGFRTKPIENNPWWIIGSMGWCITMPFAIPIMIILYLICGAF
jgi:hypothetical protein